jgi:hypothetical protein
MEEADIGAAHISPMFLKYVIRRRVGRQLAWPLQALTTISYSTFFIKDHFAVWM